MQCELCYKWRKDVEVEQQLTRHVQHGLQECHISFHYQFVVILFSHVSPLAPFTPTLVSHFPFPYYLLCFPF